MNNSEILSNNLNSILLGKESGQSASTRLAEMFVALASLYNLRPEIMY